jgi:hypothetical protein
LKVDTAVWKSTTANALLSPVVALVKLQVVSGAVFAWDDGKDLTVPIPANLSIQPVYRTPKQRLELR